MKKDKYVFDVFTLCKELSDLTCKNCMFWKDALCRTSEPPWEPTLSTDTCGEGYWYCEYWYFKESMDTPTYCGASNKKLMNFVEFVENKLKESQYREYREREEEQRIKYAEEMKGKTTKQKLSNIEYALNRFSSDIYEIREHLGLH